jgi:twitching motility protein PilU
MDLSANLRAIVSQRLVRTEDGKGRVAAIEILLNTPSIAERIFRGEFNDLKAVMAKSRELGMRTFDWALFELYNEKMISYEEAIRNADSANELRLNIKLKSERGEPVGAVGTSLELEHGPSEDELAEIRRQELSKQEARRRELEEKELAKLQSSKENLRR